MVRPSESESWHVTRPVSSVDARRTSLGFRTVYPEGDSLGAEIDLRQEIATILENRGHYVYLRRATDRRCSCFQNGEAQIDCPYCTGTGWYYEDTLYKARKMPLTDPVVAALLEQRSPIGLIGSAQFVFWFGHEVDPAPSRRDSILEVRLNETTGLPIRAVDIEARWEIGQIQGYRDQGGRIEFWACWVREGALGK